MKKFVAIVDPELATGFRLAGIETIEVSTKEKAWEKLRQVFHSSEEEWGLVAINEDFLVDTPDDLEKEMRIRPVPIVIPIPVLKEGKVRGGEEYIAGLVKECIGYYVKLR
ncbi:MAG: V-type ATP synthase subunit F [Candidatus Edwardsbacteria bacterium]